MLCSRAGKERLIFQPSRAPGRGQEARLGLCTPPPALRVFVFIWYLLNTCHLLGIFLKLFWKETILPQVSNFRLCIKPTLDFCCLSLCWPFEKQWDLLSFKVQHLWLLSHLNPTPWDALGFSSSSLGLTRTETTGDDLYIRTDEIIQVGEWREGSYFNTLSLEFK